MRSRGILAGVLRGHRRTALGPTWDSRYHRYWDAAGARFTSLRPDVRSVLARCGEREADESVSVPLRKAS